MNDVLIIDDCKIICNVIEGALDAEGIKCTSCYSGEDAKKLILENSYSSVFLDVNLPGANTVELASAIREKSFFTQIIIMSGNMEEDVFYQFSSLGVNDFFIKNKLAITDLQRVVKYGLWRQGRLTGLFPDIQ